MHLRKKLVEDGVRKTPHYPRFYSFFAILQMTKRLRLSASARLVESEKRLAQAT